MGIYGLSPTGLYAKPLTVIDDEVDAGLRGILGDAAGTDADGKIPTASLAGQLKALLVDKEAAQWDLLEAIHAELDPNKADGVFQDAICAMTGTVREQARSTVATGTCFGTPNTSLVSGRAATVNSTTARFSTATGFVLATGTAYTVAGTYSIGNLRFIAGQNRHYQCITAGLASTASGPSGTSSNFTDGAAAWKYLAEGVGLVHVPFIADTKGAIGVATGTLATIATPVDGWNVVNNLLAGDIGAAREVDAALRARRAQALAAAGNTTVDAIRANILKVNEGSTDATHLPPTACIVFYNDTDYTDANGMPPHSVEVLVQGGTTADIADAVWASVGAGTKTYGTRSDSVTDSEGNSQTVNWTRPTEIPIWLYATGRYDAAQWPAGSDTVVAQSMLSAILTYTADYPIARDVRQSPLFAAFMRGPAGTTGGLAYYPADPGAPPVPGLLEVDPLHISTATGVTGTAQITIARREIAVFSAANVTIIASSEDP